MEITKNILNEEKKLSVVQTIQNEENLQVIEDKVKAAL